MNFKKLVLGVLFLLTALHSFSQDEIWYFGAGNDGLDFSTTPATVISIPGGKGPSNGFYECNASVADGFGGLLFYSDGLNIWNKNHDVMPNGSGLLGPNEPPSGNTGSSSQGVIIVQAPGNSDKYYVIYTDCIHNDFKDGYRYSLVDMTLDGGNGDVVSGSKDVIILSGIGQANQVGEFLNAVCVNGETWVLSHKVKTNEFLAHKIDASGFSLVPVISSAGPVIGVSNIGQMRGSLAFSNNGKKIALASGGSGVYTFDFNPVTGIVSNSMTIESSGTKFYFGTEWSPDDSKLYYTDYIGMPGLYQYDVATTVITPESIGGSLGSIRLAPDGKLYAAPGWPARTSLSVINNPNEIGSAMNYTLNSQGGFSGAWITLGLPDNFVCIPLDTCKIDSVPEVCDTTTAFQFTADSVLGIWGGGPYISMSGMFDPAIAGEGTHWVTFTGPCVGPDSVQIKVNYCCVKLILDLGSDTTICENETISINVQAGYDPYEWEENTQVLISETGPSIEGDSGTYVVKIVDSLGCDHSDSIEISLYKSPIVDLGVDTHFCSVGQETYAVMMLFDTLQTGGTLTWSEGNNNSNDTLFTASYAPSEVIGTFTDSNGCAGVDTVSFTNYCKPTEITLPNLFSPGGVNNGTFHPINLTDENYDEIVNHILTSEFAVYNRWGIKVFESKNSIPNWDGMSEGKPVSSGTYFWVFEYSDSALKAYVLNGFVQVVQLRD
jgi:hypothetical protein